MWWHTTAHTHTNTIRCAYARPDQVLKRSRRLNSLPWSSWTRYRTLPRADSARAHQGTTLRHKLHRRLRHAVLVVTPCGGYEATCEATHTFDSITHSTSFSSSDIIRLFLLHSAHSMLAFDATTGADCVAAAFFFFSLSRDDASASRGLAIDACSRARLASSSAARSARLAMTASAACPMI